MAQGASSSREALLDPGAYWKHKILTTAAKLDVFSFLAGGERSTAEVAGQYGGDARAFRIFLDALAGLRLLEKRDGRYRNTRFARRHLVRDAKEYRGDQLVVADLYWDLWGKLEDTLMTGKSPLTESIFFSDPAAAQRLILGLHRDALAIAPALAERLPLADCKTLLDLGGGAGTYAIAFCQRYPNLRATVFDVPPVTVVTRSIVSQHGLDDRVSVVEGDFTADPLPGKYDAVFMSNILHGGGPERNQRLFAKVSGALEPGGWAIVRDVVMDKGLDSPSMGAVFAVNMLLHAPDARCYSFEEIAEWLAGAGFGDIETVEPNSVLTARKLDP